eukprot:TRINITY_DN5498_c0_g1_i1.p1 TRINITY_DN5498_c0_g1~~TRINITY_DN5498_c0_g1_i1.p1  ORF type:complete len:146 (-),score=26.88 TRINITY_DN5498_c0_g1_i1:183-620(-)
MQFTHFANDTLVNVILIASAWAVNVGYEFADALGSFLIAVSILSATVSPCKKYAHVLLQTFPLCVKEALDKSVREASTMEGVLECRETHFWTLAPGVYVGTLCVRIRKDADPSVVRATLLQLFSPIITHLTIQLEKDDWSLMGTS